MNVEIDKKILLINSNFLGTYRPSRITSEALGIGLLTACLEDAGFEVVAIDARNENIEISEIVSKYAANDLLAIGISVVSYGAIEWTNELIRAYRNESKNLKIFVGGFYPTLNKDIVLEKINADYAMIGEGDETIVALAKAIQNHDDIESVRGLVIRKNECIIQTPPAFVVSDLNKLPFAKRFAQEYVNETFEVLLESSRGCPNDCNFCAVKGFYRTEIPHCPSDIWRCRSARSLIDELLSLKKIYPKMKSVRITDPDFFGTPDKGFERIREFSKLVIENNLNLIFYCETRVSTLCRIDEDILLLFKKAGLGQLYIGIESGDDEMLKKMNKGIRAEDSLKATSKLKRLGIDYTFGFIMFTPWSNYSTVKKNIDFLRQLDGLKFDKLFHSLHIIPGTKWYQLAKDEGILKSVNARGNYDYIVKDKFVSDMMHIWWLIENQCEQFRDAIWFLYRDIKNCISKNLMDVTTQEKELSVLSLKIFEIICDMVNVTENGVEQEKKLLEILKRFMPEINDIQNSIETQYRVKRKMVNRD